MLNLPTNPRPTATPSPIASASTRSTPTRTLFSLPLALLTLSALLAAGCGSKTPPSSDDPATIATHEIPSDSETTFERQAYEASGDQLLAARLDEAEAAAGWIRLFDGHTFFGWEIAGDANWRIEDGTIVVDQGDPSLLCTSVPWMDYELTLEFNAEESTNSGVFLRTPLEVEDPATECYEVNIAGDDHPFPTGSVVQRQKVSEQVPAQASEPWRTMHIRLEGNELQVTLDDQLVCEYTDDAALATGRIGLQHNEGRVAFRNLRLRPLGAKSLLDEELAQWKKYPEMKAEYTIDEKGVMQVQGGKGQLETRQSYDDFVLLAEYKLATPEVNSGIFFRSIPGLEMMGYECQLNDAMKEGSPLVPADCGTGGIFRRQDARFIAGEPNQWNTVVLVAQGAKIAAWVRGVQVSDWQDEREPNENPRRGQRLQAGTIMIQGHDPTTDVQFKRFEIAGAATANEVV
ncbi:MAG: DUF1080 domain-containing protein, partial [Novipirellula sp. JB048]